MFPPSRPQSTKREWPNKDLLQFRVWLIERQSNSEITQKQGDPELFSTLDWKLILIQLQYSMIDMKNKKTENRNISKIKGIIFFWIFSLKCTSEKPNFKQILLQANKYWMNINNTTCKLMQLMRLPLEAGMGSGHGSGNHDVHSKRSLLSHEA